MDIERTYPFEFSVIMAVYNVEPFLREAVDSLIAQDFGFENIQLIMVDDGATDGSGAICDEYATQYPENVVVIHKKNGGVSSARNEGLKHATGRYLNFMDSDDKLASGTMRNVSNFFKLYENETDVVAIPMRFFDGAGGQHILNDKFQKGTRVINLLKEWKTVQLSCSSAFIKAKALYGLTFDTELAHCEDGKVMLNVLLNRMALGVLNTTTYHYRKRAGGDSSATQKAEQDPRWYTPYLQRFSQNIFDTSRHTLGYIPRFVQYSVLYHLQWHLLKSSLPVNVLGEEAFLYRDKLFSIIEQIDDEVILSQKVIYEEHKLLLLKKKYHSDADAFWNGQSAYLHFRNVLVSDLGRNKTTVDFITIEKSQITIEGTSVLLPGKYQPEDVRFFLRVEDILIPCEETCYTGNKYSLGEAICSTYEFKGSIPTANITSRTSIEVVCTIDGRELAKKKLSFGKFSPVGIQYRNSYYWKDGYMITTAAGKLYVQPCGRKGRLSQEFKFLRELWKSKNKGSRKAVIARLTYHVCALFCKKPVWLFSDRTEKAGDNGEALFRFVQGLPEPHPKCIFVLSQSSSDFRQLKKCGRVVGPLSWGEKFAFLMSDCIISSHFDEHFIRPFQNLSEPYRDISQKQKFIFLQHGVTKDDMSKWLNRYSKNIAIFVTVTEPEYQSILSGNYGYTEKQVKLTGFPRFDLLEDRTRKVITVMPTWRAYLVGGMDPRTGQRPEKPDFQNSLYFRMYSALLSNKKLFDTAEELGYTIRFLNHPNMMQTTPFSGCDQRLVFLDSNTAYRDVFSESAMIVTDYSSVAFDFAYLRKPVAYFQADNKEFFSGAHTYDKGYFDYETDGFGEVEYSEDALADRIMEYMRTGCQLKEKYRKRIDATFPFSDRNNCQRVYEELLTLIPQEKMLL